jgi:hypothetical protein
MSCTETRDLLALDEELLEPAEARLRAEHLDACAECRAEAAALVAACAELGAVETPRVSPGVREQVLSAVEPGESSLEWVAGALVLLVCALFLAWVLGTPVEPVAPRPDSRTPPASEHEHPDAESRDAEPPPKGGVIFVTTPKDGVTFYTTQEEFELNAGNATQPAGVQPVGK